MTKKASISGVVVLTALASACCFTPLRAADLDVSGIRKMVLQRDGRWLPLDTAGRDVVKEVTGVTYFQGRDPVWVLLGWTFEPEKWKSAPKIRPATGPSLKEARTTR